MDPKTYLIIVVASLILACKKSPLTETAPLEDCRWVEATHRKDTIEFKSFEDTDRTYLILHRERETGEGYNRPKLGAGVYEYRLKGNTIQIHSMLSSVAQFDPETYLFKRHGANMQIGDFYEGSDSVRAFVKIGTN